MLHGKNIFFLVNMLSVVWCRIVSCMTFAGTNNPMIYEIQTRRFKMTSSMIKFTFNNLSKFIHVNYSICSIILDNPTASDKHVHAFKLKVTFQKHYRERHHDITNANGISWIHIIIKNGKNLDRKFSQFTSDLFAIESI